MPHYVRATYPTTLDLAKVMIAQSCGAYMTTFIGPANILDDERSVYIQQMGKRIKQICIQFFDGEVKKHGQIAAELSDLSSGIC